MQIGYRADLSGNPCRNDVESKDLCIKMNAARGNQEGHFSKIGIGFIIGCGIPFA
jgi:hypothetical protein